MSLSQLPRRPVVVAFLLALSGLAVAWLALAPAAWAEQWAVPGAFATIQEAIDSPLVSAGDTIVVGPGAHAGAVVDKPVEIRGQGGAVIDSGPLHPSGMRFGFQLVDGASGTTISHLTFQVDLAIFNSGGRAPVGLAVSDVTVSHSTFLDAVQAISNWGGTGWSIAHNRIEGLRTRCGGGIGILIADFLGRTVSDNVVEHNTITGTLNVPSTDCGGYSGTGIVVYADYRWGRVGGELAFNRVVKNKVSLASNRPGLVDVVAVELTVAVFPDDPRPIDALASVHDNAIGFNDLRGTTNQIALTPASLDTVNAISRNLGENRGHGLHPSAVFGE